MRDYCYGQFPGPTVDQHQGGKESDLQGLGSLLGPCSSLWENSLSQLYPSFISEVSSRKPSQTTTQVLLAAWP